MENYTYQNIQEWHELFVQGIITEQEYTAKKAELLKLVENNENLANSTFKTSIDNSAHDVIINKIVELEKFPIQYVEYRGVEIRLRKKSSKITYKLDPPFTYNLRVWAIYAFPFIIVSMIVPYVYIIGIVGLGGIIGRFFLGFIGDFIYEKIHKEVIEDFETKYIKNLNQY